MRTRILKLNDPGIFNKYVNKLNTYYTNHKLFRKVLDINHIPFQYPIQQDKEKRCEKIDKIRVEGIWLTEKGCRKFYTCKIK